jgi:heme A synthase
MNSKFAACALTALIYFQGLLGFAGVATVLLKDRAAADTAYHERLLRIEVAAL